MANNNLLLNLLAFYPGDEAGGDLLNVHTGQKLAAVNAPTTAAGLVYGTARQYTRTGEQYHLGLNLGGNWDLRGKDYTQMIWFWMDSKPAENMRIFSKRTADVYRMEFSWYYFEGGDQIYYTVSNGVGAWGGPGYAAGAVSQWHQAIVTRDYANQTFDFWYDGVKVRDADANGNKDCFFDEPLTVGCRYRTSPEAPDNFFDGRIGPIGVWSSYPGRGGELTDEQIAQLWNAGAGLPYSSFDGSIDAAWRREYDVYLQGPDDTEPKGYFLLKTSTGNFQSGAATWRGTDPFTQQLSEEGRRSKQSFRFGAGTGCREYDGTDRYLYGENVDTRSGYIQIGPEWGEYPADVDIGEYITESWPAYTSIGDGEKAAVRLDFASRSVRMIGVMLATDRVDGPDWANILVEIWDTNTTPDPDEPNAVITNGTGVVQMTLKPGGVSPADAKPWERYGKDGNAVWYEALLPADVTIDSTYWVVVSNNSGFEVQWPHAAPLKDPTTGWFPVGRIMGQHNGVSWTITDTETAAGGDRPRSGDDVTWDYTTNVRRFPVVKTRRATSLDGIVRKVGAWFTTDEGGYTLIAAGNKLWSWDEDTETLQKVGEFDEVILDFYGWYVGDKKLLDEALFVCLPSQEIWYWRGGANPWIQLTGGAGGDAQDVGQVFGVARGLFWKGRGPMLNGDDVIDAANGWADAENLIGNGSTPILAITEGDRDSVLVLKPEGVYQVFVPDGYPSNPQVVYPSPIVDLAGEAVGRAFIEYWANAAYFPLAYGLGEYSQGFYRDTWVRRQDESGDLLFVDSFDPYYGRFTALNTNPRNFWLAKGVASPDGLYNGWPTTPDWPEMSRGLEIWAWDGRGFHQAVSERRHYAEACLALFQQSLGRGLSRVWYAHGFHIRYFNIPNWTYDKAGGDPGQDLDTYNYLENDNLPQPSDWAAGGDPPHLITPVFTGNGDLTENRTWVGVEVHFDQVNFANPVKFDVWIRWFDGQDFQQLEAVEPDTGIDDWKSGTRHFRVVPQVGPPDIEPISQWCQLAIRFDTTTYDANQQAGKVNNIRILGLDLIYDAQPLEILQYEIAIAGADYQQLHVGGKDNRTAKQIADDLKYLLSQDGTCTFTDLHGAQTTVRVLGVTESPYRQRERAPNEATGFVIETVVGVNLLNVEWP